MKRACLFLCAVVSVCSNLWSEASVPQQLYQAVQLEHQGQFHKAVEIILPVIDSTLLEQGERGRAWILLGVAYQELGEYMQAESAYEHAIQIFSPDQKYEEDYAAALDNFSDLYRNMGKVQSAVTLDKKALSIYEKLNLHAAAARLYVNLAGLELRENHRRKAKPYLSQAVEEAKLDSHLDEDFFAGLSSMQAWSASLNGEREAAISGYKRSLELWQRKYGEEHMLTGWGYMLLGNAFARAGQDSVALDDMRKGMDILERTAGRNSLKYFSAEITYSRLLDHMGNHAEAVRLKSSAKKELTKFYKNQCMDCRVSAIVLD